MDTKTSPQHDYSHKTDYFVDTTVASRCGTSRKFCKKMMSDAQNLCKCVVEERNRVYIESKEANRRKLGGQKPDIRQQQQNISMCA
eukprot:2002726-Amphidinium_carterae.2